MPQIVAPPKTDHHVTTCPHCKYTISYVDDEVERLRSDAMGVYCPNCGKAIETKYVTPFTFPDSFYYFGTQDNKNDVSNNDIKKYVKDVKSTFSHMKPGEYYPIYVGNAIIIGFKEEDEDGVEEKIIVAKNYWEDSVIRSYQ